MITSKGFRLGISLLLLIHLLALFLPPLSFQTRGPLGQSPSVAMLLRPLEAYGQFLYMDRGYAFFAPNPGPSHLIQVAVSDADGDREEIMYPDRRRQWPRLLYHRHFMLTEFLNDSYQPEIGDAELELLDADEAAYWRNSRRRYEAFRGSLVHHLEAVNPGREVAIRRIEHLIPDLVRFRERPVSLTDEDSYRVLLDQPLGLSAPEDGVETNFLPEAIPKPVDSNLPLGGSGEAESAGPPLRDSTPQHAADGIEP